MLALRTAIVHDYLNQRGGAERVVAAIHRLFPRAPVFTSIVDPGRLWPEMADARIVTSWMGTVAVADWHIRSASHPERLRWLEEQRQAKARAEMMPWRETTYAPTSAIERAFPIADTVPPDPFAAADANLLRYKAGPDARFVHVTVDLFAAVRAEAKRMMDDGVDPRLVLGALDACILRRDAAAWNAYLAIHASRALSEVVIDSRIRALEPCYHGNRAGTCGWCALSRDRSDARAVESHEPAWETADCEGE